MITPSNPAGALAATSADWKVARMFSPTASACFTTSRPTFPLAPVIRIIAVSLKQRRTLHEDRNFLFSFENGQYFKPGRLPRHGCKRFPSVTLHNVNQPA